MSTLDLPGSPRGARATASPAQTLEALRRGVVGRVLPLLQQVQAATEAELRARMEAEPTGELQDALAQVAISRGQVTMYERRWQEQISRAFDGWPKPAVDAAIASFALISDEELQAQLIGQPVIEALDRRFIEILEVIDSRLWSFSAMLGGQVRPLNLVGPRVLVESFLAAFPASECDRELRIILLKHFERMVSQGFGEFYGWFNQQLSDAGFAMARATDYAMLMATPLSGIGAPTENTIDGSADNTLPAFDASWRNAGGKPARAGQVDAVRGNALREIVRAQRAARAEPGNHAPARELRGEEFFTVLSLLQGEDNSFGSIDRSVGGIAAHLRELLRHAAAGLGMDRAATRFSAEQDDAIDMLGLLFDRLLADHALTPNAQTQLLSLTYPYLRLILSEPSLFEPPEHPALSILSSIVQLLDGNCADNGYDADLLTLAERMIGRLADDYHGDAKVLDRVHAALREELDAREKRAEIAERRASQSIHGRERLQAARSIADRMLAERLEGQPLLATVAEFLSDQWRQLLVQSWLRENEDSQRFRTAVTVGDAVIRLDRYAAEVRGRAVAEGLIALEQPLRDCYIACGLGEGGANEMLAKLVSELSRPDAQRGLREFTPLADDHEDTRLIAGHAATAAAAFSPGQALLWRPPGQLPQRLRLAWISPHSGRHLLVNRQGSRLLLLLPAEIDASVATGVLLPRALSGPVETVIVRLLAGSVAAA